MPEQQGTAMRDLPLVKWGTHDVRFDPAGPTKNLTAENGVFFRFSHPERAWPNGVYVPVYLLTQQAPSGAWVGGHWTVAPLSELGS